MENGKRITFELQERIPLEDDLRDVNQILNVELIPDIEMIAMSNAYRIQGFLIFNGEYEAVEWTEGVQPPFLAEKDAFHNKRALRKIYYRIPVDISLPAEKVDDNGVILQINSLDYELMSPNRLLLTAEIELDGVKNVGEVHPHRVESMEPVVEQTSFWETGKIKRGKESASAGYTDEEMPKTVGETDEEFSPSQQMSSILEEGVAAEQINSNEDETPLGSDPSYPEQPFEVIPVSDSHPKERTEKKPPLKALPPIKEEEEIAEKEEEIKIELEIEGEFEVEEVPEKEKEKKLPEKELKKPEKEMKPDKEKLIAKEKFPGKEGEVNKENLLGKENVANKENLLGKENVVNKENLLGKENVANKENILGKENVANKENILGKENVANKENLLGKENVPTKENPLGNQELPGKEMIGPDLLFPHHGSAPHDSHEPNAVVGPNVMDMPGMFSKEKSDHPLSQVGKEDPKVSYSNKSKPSKEDFVEEKKVFSIFNRLFPHQAEEKTQIRICIVQPEESVEEIAERYGVKADEILRLNGLHQGDRIQGSLLKIPVHKVR